MITAWQYGRLAKMPGVTPTFTFSPAQLSTRMRKAAQKMVRERLLRGGWSCESKQVAKMVMDAFAIPYGPERYGSNNVPFSGLPLEVREEIAVLLEADAAAKILTMADNPNRYGSVEYTQQSARNQIAAVRQLHNADGYRGYASFYSRVFLSRALDVVGKYNMTQDPILAEQAKRAAAILDDPTFSMNIPVTHDTY